MGVNDAILCACAVSTAQPWTPASLSNKVGWWRASNLGGSPTDGDAITAWPDSFGLLSDATGSGTYRTGANGIGGQPAIEFNGSTPDYFSTGYSGTPTDFFCWGVFDLETVNGAEAIVGKEYTTGFNVGRQASNSLVRAHVLNTTSDISNTAANYFFIGRSGTGAVFESAATINNFTVSASALSSTEMTLGIRNPAANPLTGLISEVGFLTAYPSAGDLTNLRSYITTTYGIATS